MSKIQNLKQTLINNRTKIIVAAGAVTAVVLVAVAINKANDQAEQNQDFIDAVNKAIEDGAPMTQHEDGSITIPVEFP